MLAHFEKALLAHDMQRRGRLVNRYTEICTQILPTKRFALTLRNEDGE